jgi:metallo-beta-lactamase family protein
MLRDSAHIQEEDAQRANRKGYSKHKPALPLYTSQEAAEAMKLFEVIDYDHWHAPFDGLRFRFVPAGHIVGSGIVEVEVTEGDRLLRLVFSGDVGRYDAPLVPDPTPPPPCDVLVMESTYGDREHPPASIESQLEQVLETIVRTQGTALVPAFAVGRSQQLLYLLHEVMSARPELALPIHLDSPMAVDATKIYRRYPEEDGLEELDLRSGKSRIFGRDVFLHDSVQESKRLNDLPGPRVIVSSSGMLTGGRVLHHLQRLLPDERNSIVLAGYQAPGTRGWRLQQGEKTIRIHGRVVPVRAGTSKISGLSAHADATQLVRWVRELPPPRRTFIVHGDGGAPEALAKRLAQELRFTCEIPALGQAFDL